MKIATDLEKFSRSWWDHGPWAAWWRESQEYSEELRKEAKQREEERQRLESLPPKYVIHTVHGTFASKATWIEADSGLCETLRRQLGWRARIEPFRWSGKNGVVARWEAAREFADHLARKHKDDPAAHHVVLAHSHGGNVVFWALREKALANKVLGVATLATPFLTARLRSNENLVDAGAALFAGLFTISAVLFFGVYRGLGLSIWPWALGAGIATLGTLLLGAWLIERMEEHARRICNRMPTTALSPNQVAVIRVHGDEATAAITGVRLAGILADLIWSIVSAPLYRRLSGMLSVLDYGGMRSLHKNLQNAIDRTSWRPEFSKTSTQPIQSPLFTPRLPPDLPEFGPPTSRFADWGQPREPESRARTVRQILGQGLAILILYVIQEGGPIQQTVALVCLLLYALPAAFSVATVVLGVPFAFLSSLSLLPCGWTLPLAGPYLDLVAEPCPPGSWTVTQFQGRNEPRGLFHSEAYQRDEVWQFLAQWVQDRADAFRAGAGQADR